MFQILNGFPRLTLLKLTNFLAATPRLLLQLQHRADKASRRVVDRALQSAQLRQDAHQVFPAVPFQLEAAELRKKKIKQLYVIRGAAFKEHPIVLPLSTGRHT